VALLLAFAAAGVLLVFFILAPNLTVTQGLINGVSFYANIVWAYRIILLPPYVIGNNFLVTYLQVFIAWLLELRLASLLDWMHIGRLGYSFYSHSISGPLQVLSLLLSATRLALLISSVAELFLF
jgi:hypothetical protein